MLEPITPSTPPGSPAVGGNSNHLATQTRPPSLVTRITNVVTEAQDPAGQVSVAFFALSSASAAIVLASFLGLFPSTSYGLVAAFSRTVGAPLFIVSMGFGFLSDRRLPRWFAIYYTTLAVLWYGWDSVGLPGSIYPWNFVSHVFLGLVAAVPSLLARAWRRVTRGTA